MFSSGGSGGGGVGKGGGGGDGDFGSSGFGPASVFTVYMKMLEEHPWPTKILTSAALNAAGDLLGQALFEKGKKFDWLRFAKFTFLVRNNSYRSTLDASLDCVQRINMFIRPIVRSLCRVVRSLRRF